jgi:hypothetical protein
MIEQYIGRNANNRQVTGTHGYITDRTAGQLLDLSET